jgi:arginine repressor
MTTGELTDKLKEQGVKRTSSQAALSRLLQAGKVTRIGGGKKGDPFRHFLSAEPPTPSGGKQTHGSAVLKETPTRDEQIRSAETSTLYAAERKSEREEVVL